MEPPRRTLRMITAAAETRPLAPANDRRSGRGLGGGGREGERRRVFVCVAFAKIIASRLGWAAESFGRARARARSRVSRDSLRGCPPLYPSLPLPPLPTRLSSSLSGIISARVPETGASASESFNEIDFTAGRTAGEGEPASEGIVLGMPDDVPLTVSHVLFLESSSPLPSPPRLPASPPDVKYSKRLLRFLKLQYRALHCTPLGRGEGCSPFADFLIRVRSAT